MQIAGLGEKRISLSADADAYEIYQELSYHFPKLCDAGGFELMRIPEGGGKQLDVIAAPDCGYSVQYLKAVVHHAKIFIRPLQKDLSLDPMKQQVRLQGSVTCIHCRVCVYVHAGMHRPP